MYKIEDVQKKTSEYFNGNELQTSVWINKYALKDIKGNFLESNPDEMHQRLTDELFKQIEENGYSHLVSKEEVLESLTGFKYIIPGGSVMSQLGSLQSFGSLSNCTVIDRPYDSYGGILFTDQMLVQLMKRRCGVGTDLSNIRPNGSLVNNAAGSSTGVVEIAKRYSNTTREVAQCVEENQRVLTRNGLTPIKNVKVGEDVWTQKGWIEVENVFDNGEKDLVEIETNFGFKLKVTENHIVTISGENGIQEIRVKDLSIGDNILILNGIENEKTDYIELTHNFEKTKFHKLNEDGEEGVEIEYNSYKKNRIPKYLDEDLAYLIGYSTGNGHSLINKRGKCENLTFSMNNIDEGIKNRIRGLVSKLFELEESSKVNENTFIIRVALTEICSMLEENGLGKPKTKYLRIPKKVFESKSSVQLAYLSGLFDADGYASGSKKGYVFNTINNELASDYLTLMLANGILSKKSIEIREQENWHDLYSVSVVGAVNQEIMVDKFKDSIKVQNLKWISKRDNLISPFYAKNIGIRVRDFNFVNGAKKLSINAVNRLKKLNEYKGEILTQDSVKEIRKIKNGKTFDLGLESENLFWCEGFYIHNSGRRGALLLSLLVEHLDAEQFITSKLEDGVLTGANISVQIGDEFMNAVISDDIFIQRYPVESEITDEIKEKLNTIKLNTVTEINGVQYKKIKAKKLWDLIIKTAHKSAEPGIIFRDRHHKYSTSSLYPNFRNVTTNPCVVGDTLVLTTAGWIEMQNLNNFKDDIKIITQNSDGELSESLLTWVDITEKNADIYKVGFSNRKYQHVNLSHKFYLAKDFSQIEVKDLKVGDEIIAYEKVVKISEITDLKTKRDVYDLTAVPNYNFFAIYDEKENYSFDEIIFTDDNSEIRKKPYELVTVNDIKKFAIDVKVGEEIN